MQLDLSSVAADPRFGVFALSEAIIQWPAQFGLLSNWESLFGMPLFGEKGIPETVVRVDVKKKDLHIIPSTPRGTPGIKDTVDQRGIKIFPTFRHQLDGTLLADEFQNVRAWGTDAQLDVIEDRVMEKQFDQQRKQMQTLEYLRWGALRGTVYDADGVSELYNVYDMMGEQQKTIDFHMGQAGDPIQDATDELLDHMELEAGGEPIDGVVVITSPGYHKKLMANDAFRQAYNYFAGAPYNPNRQNMRRPFEHKGVYYLRHNGRAKYLAPDGTESTHVFIPDNEAIAIPLGTQQVFRSYFAPADRVETVNTVNEWNNRMYSWIELMKGNKGFEVYSQQNPLNLVLKPRLVVRCVSTN